MPCSAQSAFSTSESNLGIAKNVLTDRLSKLVREGVMTKARLDEPGQRYAYELTRKGRDLWIPITALRLWGDKWVFGESKVPAKFKERSTGREVARLIAVDADGEPIDASDLEVAPGPGWPSHEGFLDDAPWCQPAADVCEAPHPEVRNLGPNRSNDIFGGVEPPRRHPLPSLASDSSKDDEDEDSDHRDVRHRDPIIQGGMHYVGYAEMTGSRIQRGRPRRHCRPHPAICPTTSRTRSRAART